MIEEVEGIYKGIESTKVGGVGVIDVFAVAQKHTEPRRFAVSGTFTRQIRFVVGSTIVVIGMRFVDRDLVIVVEVVAERGEPLESPSFALFEALDFFNGGARYHCERGVSRGKVRERSRKVVSDEGAVGAPLRRRLDQT